MSFKAGNTYTKWTASAIMQQHATIPCCMPSLIYLFSDVQTEAVTVSVVQLLRIVVRRLLRAHVVYGPASKGTVRSAGVRKAG